MNEEICTQSGYLRGCPAAQQVSQFRAEFKIQKAGAAKESKRKEPLRGANSQAASKNIYALIARQKG